jgi:hypothetical protein
MPRYRIKKTRARYNIGLRKGVSVIVELIGDELVITPESPTGTGNVYTTFNNGKKVRVGVYDPF